MNDREIIARLEAASPKQLVELLRRPAENESRVYAIYFGPARYEALRRRILTTRLASRAPKRGNAVILHGIMGGELTLMNSGKAQLIWLNLFRLALGAVDKLATRDGKSLYDVRATGILKKWYAEQILELSFDWNVQTYWYDWRLDLDETADDLRTKIDGWFGPESAVNFVAHSMGGLVSRTYIARHQKRWNKGGKLIMLGTPNHGSFAIPQVITGVIDTVRKLALVDLKHSRDELTAILGPLPGSLQMLPSPLVMPAMAQLYQSSTWNGRVPQAQLDRARRHHDFLAEVVDGSRMRYIAGCNRSTFDDIRDWKRLDALDGYSASMNGDGTVPHRLGFLEEKGTRIPTFFVQEDHGALPNNIKAINAVQMLLIGDKCDLPTAPENARSVAADRTQARQASTVLRQQQGTEEARLQEIVDRLRLSTRSLGQADDAPVSPEEREGEEILVRSFLREGDASFPGPSALPKAPPRAKPPRPPKIEIELLRADLRALPPTASGAQAFEAISVGHYLGVAPQYAELALDRLISGWKEGDPEEKLILTGLHKRGVLGGHLGQHYVVPDPKNPRRVAILAGMGEPGSFRVPELTLAVRELAWAAGRLNRRHLGSVLIGAGVGNLTISVAVRAWLRGLRQALCEASGAGTVGISRLTLIEKSPANFVFIHRALTEEIPLLRDDPEPLDITYLAPDAAALEAAREEAEEMEITSARKAIRRKMAGQNPDRPAQPEPVRFTVDLIDGAYEFSILSTEASIPQRDTLVDPRLIDEINNQLPTASTFLRQRDLGHLLGQMLLPQDIRKDVIHSGIPTVLAVNAATARIHFEMMALSSAPGVDDFDPEAILGPAASLTRQLRTNIAPLPEPPMMTGRPLRVLIVADPCEEAPLPGAQEEGEAVAQLFEQFRDAGANVEAPVRLIGPGAATRVSVLDHFVNQRFDVVHYAGHCFFDPLDPPRSGWLFSGNQVLSARELNRVDRIPRFVFSNACESGITPERADRRSAGLAPSFAEAFFGRGVANFICTAWPVDDAAALAFATRVYQGLLGLLGTGSEALHEAMKEARLKVARMGAGGPTTWGAYQHYGDPWFRFLAAGPGTPKTAPAPSPKGPRKRAAATPRKAKTAPARRRPSGRGKRPGKMPPGARARRY